MPLDFCMCHFAFVKYFRSFCILHLTNDLGGVFYICQTMVGRESWRPPGLATYQPSASEDTGRQMTKDDTTKDQTAKNVALILLSKGLITMPEATKLAGVSRQLMRHWAKDIPWERNRDAVVAKLWRAAIKRKR